MPLTLERLANWNIAIATESGAVGHAADELQRALEPFRGTPGAGTIRLQAGAGPGDGFVVTVAAQQVVIAGGEPPRMPEWLLLAPGAAGVRVDRARRPRRTHGAMPISG